jgi:hypothetical protein
MNMEIGTKAVPAQFPEKEYILEFFLQCGVNYFKGHYSLSNLFPQPLSVTADMKLSHLRIARKSLDRSLEFPHCVLFLDCPEQMERGALDTPQFVFRHLPDNSLLFMLQRMWTWWGAREKQRNGKVAKEYFAFAEWES